MIRDISREEYIEFLNTREQKDIILIKEELHEDILKLKKDVKRFKLYSFILKNRILNKIFRKKISEKIINISPNVETTYKKKLELYNIVNNYLKKSGNK